MFQQLIGALIGRQPVHAEIARNQATSEHYASVAIDTSEVKTENLERGSSRRGEGQHQEAATDFASLAQSLAVERGHAVLLEPATGAVFSLGGPQIAIGRSTSNDVSLHHDRTVSRNHATIARVGDSYIITDLASTNGTQVNGERVAAPRVLKHADVIYIGATTVIFLAPRS